MLISVRPKIAELIFQLYSRPLHPELFHVYQSQTLCRGDYEAKIDITSGGHVVTWRYAGLTLTEVAASAQHPLPLGRRVFSHRLKGQQSERVDCRGNTSYEVSFQLEPVAPEIFWTYQQELARHAQRRGMFHQFDSSGRIALGAISYIHLETRNRSLLVQACIPFPTIARW